MFIGEFRHTTDAKGRLSIPSILREDLGESFIVARGLDRSLFVFTLNEWEIYCEKITELPLTQRRARNFTRYLLAGATQCSLDKSGRVLIPQHLRDFAGIEKETVIIGAGSRVEIWSEPVWNEYYNTELNYEEFAIDMEELGI